MKRATIVAALAALVVATPAGATVFKVDWREHKTVADRTAVQFRITRIAITPRSWSMTLSIHNGTHGLLKVTTPALGTTPIPTLSVTRPEQYRGETALVDWDRHLTHDPTAGRLPGSIAAGATWTGTLGGTGKSGTGKMRHGRYVVGLGWFEPQYTAAGTGFYWITDHSVRW